MHDRESFFADHVEQTRRYFLKLGAVAAGGLLAPAASAGEQPGAKELARAVEKLDD